jgi:hypothetical protein
MSVKAGDKQLQSGMTIFDLKFSCRLAGIKPIGLKFHHQGANIHKINGANYYEHAAHSS